MPKVKSQFSTREIAAAKAMAKYEDLWVAVSKKSGREVVVASGARIIDAKTEADKKGLKNVTYRKVPASGKILIARLSWASWS